MSNTHSNRILRRNPEMIHANMGEELVIMSLTNGKYYGINDVGSAIWKLLENSLTIDQLIYKLSDIYGISAEQCQKDIEVFLINMEDQGIIANENDPT